MKNRFNGRFGKSLFVLLSMLLSQATFASSDHQVIESEQALPNVSLSDQQLFDLENQMSEVMSQNGFELMWGCKLKCKAVGGVIGTIPVGGVHCKLKCN